MKHLGMSSENGPPLKQSPGHGTAGQRTGSGRWEGCASRAGEERAPAPHAAPLPETLCPAIFSPNAAEQESRYRQFSFSFGFYVFFFWLFFFPLPLLSFLKGGGSEAEEKRYVRKGGPPFAWAPPELPPAGCPGSPRSGEAETPSSCQGRAEAGSAAAGI